VSDLWDRCRLALRERLGHDDWCQAIAPLRAWFDADVLYLWIDRGPKDWRTIANPAEKYDREIRDTVRLVCGRAPKGVHYLTKPPNREHIINQRRIPEHRERMHGEAAKRQKTLVAYAMEECARLAENPSPQLLALMRTCTSDEERLVKLRAFAMDRAKHRLDNEPLRSIFASRNRGEPPREPPPWSPPSQS
jgi:hypothetical protein